MTHPNLDPSNPYDSIYLNALQTYNNLKADFKLFIKGIAPTDNHDIPPKYQKEFNRQSLILKQRYNDLLDYLIIRDELIFLKESLNQQLPNEHKIAIKNQQESLFSLLQSICHRMKSNAYPFTELYQNPINDTNQNTTVSTNNSPK